MDRCILEVLAGLSAEAFDNDGQLDVEKYILCSDLGRINPQK
jgi:hypothetical protein